MRNSEGVTRLPLDLLMNEVQTYEFICYNVEQSRTQSK